MLKSVHGKTKNNASGGVNHAMLRLALASEDKSPWSTRLRLESHLNNFRMLLLLRDVFDVRTSWLCEKQI
jgi:hypothetical protein